MIVTCPHCGTASPLGRQYRNGPEIAAAIFELYTDESVADVFIALAHLARDRRAAVVATRPSVFDDPHPLTYWRSVGRHLADCTCSDDEARELVRELYAGLTSEGA